MAIFMNTMSHDQEECDKVLSYQQIAKILMVCRTRAETDLSYGRKNWVTRSMLVNLAFKSGLKVGEISRLRIRDLTVAAPDCCIRVGDDREGDSRPVFIYPGLAKQIKDYLNFKRFSWGETLEDSQFLLAHKAGRPYTTAALNFSFKKAVEEAGIPSLYTIHNARHSYAVLLLSKTNDLQFVKNQLGHTKKSSTTKYLDLRAVYSKEAALEILS